MAFPRELQVLFAGVPVAVARQAATGRLSLSYDPAWRANPRAQSISLSLPFTQIEHSHRAVFSYLSGLLPDNPNLLQAWANEFGVSARNPFALLARLGEDCAGAVQFVREERLEEVLNAPDILEPRSEKEIGEALRRLRHNAAPWPKRESHGGAFSLAGAQAKLALRWTGEGWASPGGRAASTHILKPPSDPRFPGTEVNEHVCLSLARHLGIPAARSRIERFADEVAIVVERFDRRPGSGAGERLHQEDTCQALGIPPASRYQADGGPGFTELANLARTHSADEAADLQQILGAAALNWIIGGTDAHAKNYSWFITSGDEIRMTPLYDVISSLPYYDLETVRLAMPIGGENQFLRIGRSHWSRFAETLGAEESDVVRYVRELAEAIPAILQELVLEVADRLEPNPVRRLQGEIASQADRCAAVLS